MGRAVLYKPLDDRIRRRVGEDVHLNHNLSIVCWRLAPSDCLASIYAPSSNAFKAKVSS